MIIIVSITNIVNIVIEAKAAEKLLVDKIKVIETMTMLALRLMLVIVIQITGGDHEEGWRN